MFPSLGSMFTTDWRQVDWRRTLYLVLLVLAIAAALWQYFMPEIREINTTTFRRVKEIQKVKEVRRVLVPCPEGGIEVLDRAEASQRLHIYLPPTVSTAPPRVSVPTQSIGSLVSTMSNGSTEPYDDSAQLPEGMDILATGSIPPTDNGAEALAVIDWSTRKTSIDIREKAAPWFQFTNRGALGVRYGIDQRLRYIGNVYGKWDFLRVKDMYFSAVADLETGGDAKLQAGAEYRW